MTTTIRPIKTNKDYASALKRIEELMSAEAGTAEADELEVLATLIELYEKQNFPIDLPEPIDAIRFRMEQAGLTNRDLVPVLGSRSRVSEVLAGKRPLTLSMIRGLHEHLGIPADVLLHRSAASLTANTERREWARYPLRAMAKLGWIENAPAIKDRAEEIMCDLLVRAGGASAVPALYRKNDGARQKANVDEFALEAWCLQLIALARATPLAREYKDGVINDKFARTLVRKSWLADGPRLAREYLGLHGIHLIYLPHLPRTHFDCAALKLADGTPVIGLTLRYDRLDNFWFCLCHELAHVSLHMKGERADVFIDDLSLPTTLDKKEREADAWAQDILIPSESWNKSSVRVTGSAVAVNQLANELGIHPSIVAGRVRTERRNYHLLTQFIGAREVRKHFLSARCAA